MAIICGHYDFVNKIATFEGAACDSGNYCGEYIFTGIHANQIAVTVSEVNCDDIYYGCIDPATGNFSVTIPDNCCFTCTSGGNNSCDDITYSPCCWDNGSIPDYLIVKFSGVRRGCDDSLITELNTCHCLAFYGGYCNEMGYMGVVSNVDFCGTSYNLSINTKNSDGDNYFEVIAIGYSTVFAADEISCYYGDCFSCSGVDSPCCRCAPPEYGCFPCPPCSTKNYYTSSENFGYGGYAIFEDASEQLSASAWQNSYDYIVGDVVLGTDGKVYGCILAHTSTTNDRPITGANWATYWFTVDCS